METKIETYAPVVIPTLCRYEHFKRCIESLSRCTGAEHTEVYVGLDYPAKDAHRDGYEKIREYLESCGNLGFKRLVVVKREYNYGIGEDGNYCKLRDEIFERYDRMISSEDDNEFSPNFLEYMNKGLELFKDDKDIFSITGFCHDYDLGDYTPNYYLQYGACAWGYGVWRDKYHEYEEFYKSNPPRTLLLSKNVFKLLGDPGAIGALLIMNRKRVRWGDYYMSIFCLIKNKYNVFPTMRKVRNWGMDGSGVNCYELKDNVFARMPIDNGTAFEYDNVLDVKSKIGYICHRLKPYKRLKMRSYIKLIGNAVIFIPLLIVDLFDKKRCYPR